MRIEDKGRQAERKDGQPEVDQMRNPNGKVSLGAVENFANKCLP